MLMQTGSLWNLPATCVIGKHGSNVTCSYEHRAERWRALAGCQVQRSVSAKRAHVNFRLQLRTGQIQLKR